MSRRDPRLASKMSVTQTRNALAAAAVAASRTSIPESSGGGGGTGDVTGPSGSMDDTIALFDGVTGKQIKDSTKTLSDLPGFLGLATVTYVDDQDTANSAADQAYADGVAATAESNANSYTDSEVAANSVTDQAYTDSEISSAIAGLASIYASLGVIKGVQQFTANGTYTPTAGTKSFLVLGVGSGGGGGGVGSSAAAANTRIGGGRGGAGELRAAAFAVNVASYTVTVGAVGSGGAAGNNNGSDGGDVILNDGTTDIFVCKGGAGGTGSPGNTNGSTGANGTGGTGGIELSGLLVSGGSFPNFAGTAAGAYNLLFGAAIPSVTNATSDSTGSLVLSSGATGSSGIGRGSGASGGWHWNGSVATFGGGIGSRGYILILEFA